MFCRRSRRSRRRKKILSNFLRQNEKTENYNTSKEKINKLKCEIIFIFDIVFFKELQFKN